MASEVEAAAVSVAEVDPVAAEGNGTEVAEEREREEDEGSEQSRKQRRDKKKKKHKSEKRKNRDRSRERSNSRERSDRSKRRNSRDRSKDRSGSRDRGGDRERDRDRRRDRDGRDDSRDRRRYRSSRRRSRSRSYRRRRSDSRDRRSYDRRRDERRDRSRSRERAKSTERTEGGTGSSGVPGVPTLKEIMFENPGFSVQDALRKQAEIKVSLGIDVPGYNVPRPTPFGGGGTFAGAGGFSGGAGGFGGAAGFGGGAGGFGGAMGAPGVAGGVGAASALPSAANKTHRELYVGNLPPGAQSPQIVEFINNAMVSSNLNVQPGPSVLAAWVSSDGHYAFVEFRTAEEATSALNFLNGLAFGTYNLRIGRPRGYVPDPNAVSAAGGFGLGTMSVPGIPSLAPVIPGVGPVGVEESNTLMLTNLPKDVASDQVRELVTAFGPLKAFNMIVDPNGKARATAVFEYEDASVTAGVVQGLTDFELGDQKLGIQRVPASVAATLLQPSGQLPDLPPTRALRLSNMVTAQDMADAELMEEIKEDVADECNKHGTVLSVAAPAAGDGAGYVFVQFANAEGCGRAKDAIGGRSFNGNIVAAQYYPEELFEQQVFQPPAGYFDKK